MIHFFRRIRQSLLRESKFRKYILYALGEIALVMIGILLALQVNNWNEDKKTDAYELRLLEGVHNSIENELNDWQFILNNNYKGDTSYHKIVQLLENEIAYQHSLNLDFNRALNTWYHELNNTAFETIKGYGLNFIHNQKTVDHLSDMYERWHKIYEETDDERNRFHYSVAAPYLFDLFERKIGIDGYEYIPINNQGLLNDRKFRSLLEQQQIYRRELIKWQERILEDMHESLELLELEMNRY